MDKFSTIEKEFKAKANHGIAIKMSAYMRDKFKYYGLATPIRKSVYKDFLSAEKKAGKVDWDFLDKCYQSDYREFQYLVIDYLVALERFIEFEDVPRIEKYIKTKQWWDTIDGLDRIIGNIKDSRISNLMISYSLSDDFWVRRIAIDHQLCRKDKTDAELLGKIILNNLGSSEFFINKAIGWALRDYSKYNVEWVRSFVSKYKNEMNSLSVREASKYL